MMKKLLSLLLCVALVASFATVALASTDDGLVQLDPSTNSNSGFTLAPMNPTPNNPQPEEPETPENPVVPTFPDRLQRVETYTIEIPITKQVVQVGSKAPGKMTFSFLPGGFGYSGDDLTYSVSGNTITTDGPGEYSTTMKITVTGEDMFWNLSEGFSVYEQNDGAADWTYDASVWDVRIYDMDDYAYSYRGGMNVPKNAEGLYFVNFHEAEEAVAEPAEPSKPNGGYLKPVLNKTDHFAFMKGRVESADGNIFAVEENMTRAEVATMFARLMVEQMEVGVTYPCSFPDVKPSHWAANFIGYMERYGVMLGDDDGNFRPDDPITRAEFATVASRFDELTEGESVFSDVPATHWAAKYINFAAAKGWVTGYDGKFYPERNITRAEVVTITCRVLERSADKDYVKQNYDVLPRTFKDVPNEKSHWAYWAIMEAANGHDYFKTGADETWTLVYQ